jgi:hypothetical protein
MAEARHGSIDSNDKTALRSLVAEFCQVCETLPPCWYRIDSEQNNFIKDGKTKALLPSLSDLFGMFDKRANDLLFVCGLLKYQGGKHHTQTKKWDELKSEYGLDIEIEKSSHASLIGDKVWLVRIGSFEEETRNSTQRTLQLR